MAIVLRGEKTGMRLSDAPLYPGATPLAVPAGSPTLGEIAQVRLAPWLGSPGIFVVDQDVAARLPADCLVPAVDTNDILDGELRAPRRYAIRTLPDTPPPAAVMAHLRSNLHLMAARGLRKQDWLPPETWHRMSLERPALLVPCIARSLRPVRLPAGVLAINHNLSIVAAGSASLDEIEELLNSRVANEWVKAHAAPLEGGFYSLTTTLLRRLPVLGA